jgi:hypothetical protein
MFDYQERFSYILKACSSHLGRLSSLFPRIIFINFWGIAIAFLQFQPFRFPQNPGNA